MVSADTHAFRWKVWVVFLGFRLGLEEEEGSGAGGKISSRINTD